MFIRFYAARKVSCRVENRDRLELTGEDRYLSGLIIFNVVRL
ncbi:hypothetical protein [Nitrosomonas sp. sh817]|nr:hypothetical protein [Nitrosomonas sp. sh817]